MFWLVRALIRGLSAGRPRHRPREGSAGPVSPPWSGSSRDKPPGMEPQRTLTGRCHVVDGDTIIVRGQSIRLAGIDAPELDHPYGRNARLALIELCRGQIIRAEPDGEFTYGRLSATCFLPDGRDLAAEMVRLGHAVDWRKFSGGRYRHLEVPGARKRLWRCDMRQKGRLPPSDQGRGD